MHPRSREEKLQAREAGLGYPMSAVVVGLGSWSYVLVGEAEQSGLSVAGYVSEHTARAADGRPVVQSLEAAMKAWNPDVAIVATRPERTGSSVCAALAKGLHVFAEKPLALSTEDFQLVVAAMRRHSCAVTVDYTVARQALAALPREMGSLISQGTSDVILSLPPRDHGMPTDPQWAVRWLPHILSLGVVLGADLTGWSIDSHPVKWTTDANRLTGHLPSGARISLRCDDDIQVRNVSIGDELRIDLPAVRGNRSPVALGMQEFRRRIDEKPPAHGEIEGRALEVSELVSHGIASWIGGRATPDRLLAPGPPVERVCTERAD